ncbi:MAG: GNAT family N-acetyltransferase [Chloroflexi bacterium]|nr:GNAT family N-acetyltransferase [Chloroflexota bacterium]
MTNFQSPSPSYHLPITLGDGLVLRHATRADTDAFAQFNAANLGRDTIDAAMVTAWARDLISEQHPACGPENIFIVEEPREKKIVSSMVLIPQTWTYAGIPFGVGRPEAVSTHPDYRRRGLVRKQFEALHAQSAAQGHLVQGITGIYWYYRQFDYEYALDLGASRVMYFAAIPALKVEDPAISAGNNESEAYRLRAMTLADIPFAARLYDRDCARSLVACPRDEKMWRHLLAGYARGSGEYRPYQIIETLDGCAVGYVAPMLELGDARYRVIELAVDDAQSLRAAMSAVLRGLKPIAEAEAARQKKKVNAFQFGLGREHPLYQALPELLPQARVPYGWYVRVADVPAFLRRIAPALDARLARSPLAGHSGEIKITEYRRGFRIAFENGKMKNAEAWTPVEPVDLNADAGFPPLVFLKLLFGRESLAELCVIFPDCWAKDDAAALLDVLFPKMNSIVHPVG